MEYFYVRNCRYSINMCFIEGKNNKVRTYYLLAGIFMRLRELFIVERKEKDKKPAMARWLGMTRLCSDEQES